MFDFKICMSCGGMRTFLREVRHIEVN